MILHVLPGDALLETFRSTQIEGEVAVCRECLIAGDVSGETLPEFWENRERFVARENPDVRGSYHETVVREFAKLMALQSGSEANLWFEYELFCQTNMWFCLSLLRESTAEIFRVVPVTAPEDQTWDGFARLPPDDLKKCFAARVKMTDRDVELGANLWAAYRNGDHSELERLSTIESPAFPKLREVCAAEIEKEFRPREIISEIVQNGETDFGKIFVEFRSRAGVYGYGDTQVKKIYHDLLV